MNIIERQIIIREARISGFPDYNLTLCITQKALNGESAWNLEGSVFKYLMNNKFNITLCLTFFKKDFNYGILYSAD